MSLQERYLALKEEVATAARASGRRAEKIHVVLVSKYGTPEQIRELIELGHRHFGEGRTQQLEQRSAMIREWLVRRQESGVSDVAIDPDAIRWHMVGHLQRNKVKKTVEYSRLIHGVDSLRLAEEVQLVAAKQDRPVELLLQVNTSGEKQKHGVAPPAVRHLVDQIDTMVNVSVRGLMCMAENTQDQSKLRGAFERCYELFEEIQRLGGGGEDFDILSMGMSNDFKAAIECGSNCIRVGSAVFQDAGRASEEDAASK
ncbi:MAG: YggS family pyridoxal phosphate-dependent enzyme [Phycisphaerales bacterium]|nr:YggS family pyridoxal phosphate-dependent enzyme [Phycisphaerales bacterium]